LSYDKRMILEHWNGDIASHRDSSSLSCSSSEPYTCMRCMSVSVKPREKMITKPSHVKTSILYLLSKVDRIRRIKPSSCGTHVITYFELQSPHQQMQVTYALSLSGLRDHFQRCSMLTHLIWNISQLAFGKFESYL